MRCFRGWWDFWFDALLTIHTNPLALRGDSQSWKLCHGGALVSNLAHGGVPNPQVITGVLAPLCKTERVSAFLVETAMRLGWEHVLQHPLFHLSGGSGCALCVFPSWNHLS